MKIFVYSFLFIISISSAFSQDGFLRNFSPDDHFRFLDLKMVGNSLFLSGSSKICGESHLSRYDEDLKRMWRRDFEPGSLPNMEIFPDSSILIAYPDFPSSEFPSTDDGIRVSKISFDGTTLESVLLKGQNSSCKYGSLGDSLFVVGAHDTLWAFDRQLNLVWSNKASGSFSKLLFFRNRELFMISGSQLHSFFDISGNLSFTIPLVSGNPFSDGEELFFYENENFSRFNFNSNQTDFLFSSNQYEVRTYDASREGIKFAGKRKNDGKQIIAIYDFSSGIIKEINSINDDLIELNKFEIIGDSVIILGKQNEPEPISPNDLELPFLYKSLLSESEIYPKRDVGVTSIEFFEVPKVKLRWENLPFQSYETINVMDMRVEFGITNFGLDTVQELQVLGLLEIGNFCFNQRFHETYKDLNLAPGETIFDTMVWRPYTEVNTRVPNPPGRTFKFYSILPDKLFDGNNNNNNHTSRLDYVVPVREPDISHHFSVSPNPVSDHFILQYDGNKPLEVELLNSLGQVIHLEKIKSNSQLQWNRKNEPAGLYFLHVKSEEGRGVKTIVLE